MCNALSKPAMSYALGYELDSIVNALRAKMGDVWPAGWALSREEMERKHPAEIAAWDAFRYAVECLEATTTNAILLDVNELPGHAVVR